MENQKKTIVFSTGAGMSAESGIATFRDAGGLWDKYPVMQVASADGFAADPELVHNFYNARRHELLKAQPNAGHKAIAELEKHFNVKVITQNVDNLHERAGSHDVLHLHGELMKARAIDNESLVFDLKPETLDTHPDTIINGHKVRPHIVFFQEAVPNFEPATEIAATADVFVVIGTSLVVYPAAALLNYVKPGTPIYYIDPNPAKLPPMPNLHIIRKGASEGMKELTEILLKTEK